MKPLEGTTVLSLEQAVAAPLASRHLADLGARVLKLERPAVGDFARHYDASVHGESSYFVWLNRSKESFTLDLKHPRGTDVLERIVARVDVLLHNLGPGALERLGLSLHELRGRHPALVTCAISGYGGVGPFADRKAYDLLIQAETGLIDLSGTPANPAKVGISIADISAGTYAFSAILAALLGRHRTGQGAHIDISMLESLGEWLGAPWYYARYGGRAPGRHGTHHATIAPYGEFTCAGGERLFLGIQNEREWRRFCRSVLQRPELADDARFDTNSERVAHRAELWALIEDAFESTSAEALARKLDDERIANARLRSVERFAEHPQLRGRNRVSRTAAGGAEVEALLPPFNISNADPVMGDVPSLGRDTDSVLAWAGYTAVEIARLHAEGVT